MIISTMEFNEIIKAAKLIKDDIVTLYNGVLYSSDEYNTCLKCIKVNVNPSLNFSLAAKEIKKEFLSTITDTEIVLDKDKYLIYCMNNLANTNPGILIPTNNHIVDLYNKLMHESTYSIFNRYENIKEDQDFLNILDKKSKDGATMYKKDKYIMYIFSGLLPINKSDKVNLNIYDIGPYFISNFEILKKKTEPINVFIRYMHLK